MIEQEENSTLPFLENIILELQMADINCTDTDIYLSLYAFDEKVHELIANKEICHIDKRMTELASINGITKKYPLIGRIRPVYERILEISNDIFTCKNVVKCSFLILTDGMLIDLKDGKQYLSSVRKNSIYELATKYVFITGNTNLNMLPQDVFCEFTDKTYPASKIFEGILFDSI